MKSIASYISLLLAALVIGSCTAEEFFPQPDGNAVSVTFRPVLDDSHVTRTIGDASQIDNIVVGVYEGTETLSRTYTCEKSWDEVQTDGLSLSLIEGRTYKIIFWAEHSDNTAYTLTDDGIIKADYTDYLNGGFAKMEELDAFYAVSTLTIGALPEEEKQITLSRPLAQLNFADNATQPVRGTHKAVVTFKNIPVSFDPVSGSITTSKTETVFTFTDFPTEVLSIESVDYYYVATNYILASASGQSEVEVTLNFQQASDGSTIKTVALTGEDAVTVESNKKTNVLGSIVKQPETWSKWDGVIPTVSPLTTDSENRYIIDEAADIAWLSVNGASLNGNSTFVQTIDIDMDKRAISGMQLPAGSTYDGGEHIIKNYANSLFGDATNLTVSDLTVEESTVTAGSGVTHIGTLVNTLTGSSTFSNVVVSGSSVSTTNGAAGGLVGYIQNKAGETLSVTFSGCKATDNTVSGSLTSGVYVGRFRGYDNSETLRFSSDNLESAATFPTTAAQPYYVTGNVATWLASKDYAKYSGWLGDEEFNRGIVTYGADRYIPCWDGTKKVTPLTDGSVKLIYSAFDLAALQGSSPGTIKFMENVDMEHDLDGASKSGERKHIFNALSTLTTLEGNGKTIYNISIRDNYYGGFVKSDGCATTFRDITFDGADIRVTHDATTGNAYVGTLRGFAYGATTIDNVHVKNGYMQGVNKMGGLCGGIFSKITCSNSSVQKYCIENYDSEVIEKGFKANGEIGGLVGYITVLDASTVNTISNCFVSDNTFNCVTYDAELWDRSVAPFIGDIRTQEAGQVKIQKCEIKGINTYTNAETGKSANFDQYSKLVFVSWKPTYKYYPLVGQCYAVIFLDSSGKVYIDNEQIF